jgi:hypothetical protein
MKFGQKVSGGSSFGQRVHKGAIRLFQKYGDIVSKAGNLGYAIGSGLSMIGFPEVGAPVIALSSLAEKSSTISKQLGSALEKSQNPHNKLA